MQCANILKFKSKQWSKTKIKGSKAKENIINWIIVLIDEHLTERVREKRRDSKWEWESKGETKNSYQMPRCKRRSSRRGVQPWHREVRWQRCGPCGVRTCGAFLSLQSGVSLQAKPSWASDSPVPVQQGLAQPSIIHCLRQFRNSLTLNLDSFFLFFFFFFLGLATVHQQ